MVFPLVDLRRGDGVLVKADDNFAICPLVLTVMMLMRMLRSFVNSFPTLMLISLRLVLLDNFVVIFPFAIGRDEIVLQIFSSVSQCA